MIYRTIIVSIALFLITGCGSSEPKILPSSPAESQENQDPVPVSSSDTSDTDNAPEANAETDATASTDPKSKPVEYDPSDFGNPSGSNAKAKTPQTTDKTKSPPVSPSLNQSKSFNSMMSKKLKDLKAILKGKTRTRPEDPTKWVDTDFIPARNENDLKLKMAIEHHSKKRRGDPVFAMILAEILKPKTSEPAPNSQNNGGGMGHTYGGGMGGGQTQQIDQQLVEMIVLRLAWNNTPEAARILRKIIQKRNYNILHPQTATKAALQGLAVMDVDCPDNDEVLFNALTNPRKYRKKSSTNTTGGMYGGSRMSYGGGMSGGDQRMSAEKLAQEAERCLKPIASEKLRESLAGYLLKGSTTGKERQKFRPWFTKSSPTNVLGQLRLYAAPAPRVPADLLTEIEKQLTIFSRLAIARLLDICPITPDLSNPNAMKGMVAPKQSPTGWGDEGRGGSGFGAGMGMGGPMTGGYRGGYGNTSDFIAECIKENTKKTSNEEKLVELTQKIWSPVIASAVGNRLNQTPNQNATGGNGFGGMGGGSANDSQSVSLACTMPLDTVRHAIFKRCKSHYQKGPNVALGNALGQSTGGGAGNSMDPDTSAAGGAMGGMGMGGGTNSTLQAIDPGLLVVLKMLPREDPYATNGTGGRNPGTGIGGAGSMQHQWFATSRKLVTKILGQCLIAASPVTGITENDPCPLAPHKGAEVVKRLDFTLPGGAKGLLGRLPTDSLEIHYIRIEEIGNLQRIVAHYKRAVKDQNHVLSGNMGYWFDGISEGSTPGTKRSVDVIISPGVEKPVDPFGGGRNTRKKKGVPIVVQILTIEIADPMVPK